MPYAVLGKDISRAGSRCRTWTALGTRLEMHSPKLTTIEALKTVLAGLRSGSGLLMNIAVVAAFGVLVPYRRGIDFFDPLVFFSYSAIALLFAGSAATDLMQVPDARRSAREIAMAATIYGWVAMVVIYVLGITTVNVDYRAGRFLHPAWPLLGSTILFGLCGAALFASLAVMLAIVFSPAAARTVIRLLFVGIVAGAYFGVGRLPESWQLVLRRNFNNAGMARTATVGAVVSAVLAGGLIAAFTRAERPEN